MNIPPDITRRVNGETRKVIDQSWALLRATGDLAGAYKASQHLMRKDVDEEPRRQKKRRGSFSMIDPKADER